MSRTIAILGGTGPAGMGLALRWARAGETVIIGSRDAERANAAAEKIHARVPDAKIWGAENAAACSATECLMLTVPFEGQAALLKQLKPAIKPGSILIDATVPLAASVGGRATRTLGVWQGSAAQQTAELAGKEVAVVAAFQNIQRTCSMETMRSSATLSFAAMIPRLRKWRWNWRLQFLAYVPLTAASWRTRELSNRLLPC